MPFCRLSLCVLLVAPRPLINIMAIACCVSVSAEAFAQGKPAASEASEATTGVDVPVPEEVGSRILPQFSGFRGFEGTTFSLGVYVETLQHRANARYKPSGLGVSVAFDQHIRGAWSGGLQARWSDWEARFPGPGQPANVSPLSVFSHIEAAPSLGLILGESLLTRAVRPFAVAGLGYSGFWLMRGIPLKKAQSESTEPSATFGGGVRLVWPRAAALRLSIERWRSLRTFRYSAMTYQMEVQFGDVERF